MEPQVDTDDVPPMADAAPGSSNGRRLLLGLLALAVLGGAFIAYTLLLSSAAGFARELPSSARLESVTALVGSQPTERKQRGDLLVCTFRFDDLSQLKCTFVEESEEVKYTELEYRTEIVGTTLERTLSGFIPNMYGAIPTYDYASVPQYGQRFRPVEKTRAVKSWRLGRTNVGLSMRLPDLGRTAQPPSTRTSSYYAPTPTEPPAETQIPDDKPATSSAADYYRGHIPQPGSKQRKALMDAARKRLDVRSKFIVQAIVVAGSHAVADIKPEGGGKRRVVEFKKKSGKWSAVRVDKYTADRFEELTGITSDTEVTGEL